MAWLLPICCTMRGCRQSSIEFVDDLCLACKSAPAPDCLTRGRSALKTSSMFVGQRIETVPVDLIDHVSQRDGPTAIASHALHVWKPTTRDHDVAVMDGPFPAASSTLLPLTALP